MKNGEELHQKDEERWEDRQKKGCPGSSCTQDPTKVELERTPEVAAVI